MLCFSSPRKSDWAETYRAYSLARGDRGGEDRELRPWQHGGSRSVDKCPMIPSTDGRQMRGLPPRKLGTARGRVLTTRAPFAKRLLPRPRDKHKIRP